MTRWVLRHEDALLPGRTKTVAVDVIRHPGAAAILPLDGDDVILIRQWRHAAGAWLWEVPCGTLNDGEMPRACAERELVEEAGVAATTFDDVGFVYTAPGFCDERIWLFVARGLASAPVARDDDEVIAEVRRFSYDDALAMVEDGTIVDAKSIALLVRGRRFRARPLVG